MAHQTRVRLLIVTGSSLRAEEADRPLAYYLKQQIEQLQSQAEGGPDTRLETRVVADFRWLNEDSWQQLPTISLGGPGVNALAHRWLEEVPLSLAIDGQYYVQMDPDLSDLRVSIWGMDNSSTQIAVSAFVQRFLPQFLDHCRRESAGSVDPEDD
jgi:hypothetical protein